MKNSFRIFIRLVLIFVMFGSPSFAKEPVYRSAGQILAPDELLHQGQNMDLYLYDVIAMIIVAPEGASADIKAMIEQEATALTAFLPQEPSDELVFAQLSRGRIEIDNYKHRYIFDVDSSKPGLLISSGHSQRLPVFVPYHEDVSFVEEVKNFFEKKDRKKFNKYIEYLNRKARDGDEGKYQRAYKSFLRGVATTTTPKLTKEQTRRVNDSLLSGIDNVTGYTAYESYFTQPFKKLTIALDYKEHGRVSEEYILRNSKQQNVFSYTNSSDKDSEGFRNNDYHSNGLLSTSRQKRIRHSQDKINHTISHVFWESDYVANVYSRIPYRWSSTELDSVSVSRITFDQTYRRIENDMKSYSPATKKLSISFKTTSRQYDEAGGFVQEDKHPRDQASNPEMFAPMKSIHTAKDGKIVNIEYFKNYFADYMNVDVSRDLTTTKDREGKITAQRTRSFNKGGYLIREESVRSSGDSTIVYEYEL